MTVVFPPNLRDQPLNPALQPLPKLCESLSLCRSEESDQLLCLFQVNPTWTKNGLPPSKGKPLMCPPGVNQNDAKPLKIRAFRSDRPQTF
jgi:hypothetical protein